MLQLVILQYSYIVNYFPISTIKSTIIATTTASYIASSISDTSMTVQCLFDKK